VDDDGAAGVTIAESGVPADTVVAENGGTDSYTVVLDSRPTHDVVVTVTSQTPLAAVVNRSGGTKGPVQTLTFTPSGWNTAQTVIVEGVPDVLDNTNNRRTVEITHTVASADPSYNRIAVSLVEVEVTDGHPLPLVSVSAVKYVVTDGVDAYAEFILRGRPAQFGGTVNYPIHNILYDVSGTGVAATEEGLDRTASITSDAGTSIRIAIADGHGETDRVIIVTIQPGGGYRVDRDSISAIIIVEDND